MYINYYISIYYFIIVKKIYYLYYFYIIMKIIYIFIFVILLLLKYKKTEFFNEKPIIWLYWENKPNETMPSYLKLCLDTIYKHCSIDFNIIILDEKTVFDYLPNLRTDLNKLLIAQKTDYIRIKLLYEYGGLWLDIDTIVMSSLKPIITKLKTYDFVGFGCSGKFCTNGYSKPSNGALACKKNNILMKNILNDLDSKLDKQIDNYEYKSLGKYVIWKHLNILLNKNYKYYHYDSSYDGTRMKNKRWVRPHYYFNSQIDLLNENNLFFILLSNNTIAYNHKEFMLLTKDEILNRDYWISKMFKKSLKL